MTTVKIARQAYRRARQSTLSTFAENVFTRMSGLSAYQAVQPQVDALKLPLENYQNSLAAARNRGLSEVLAKNLSQPILIRQLDTVADALEALQPESAQLIVDAGFTIQQTTGTRYSSKLPAPVILRASSTGKKGEIRVVVDDLAPNSVLTHAVEYSLDREAGWQNGTYNSHRNFVARDLPHAPALWLRLRSIGHGDNRSEWSDPVSVAVL